MPWEIRVWHEDAGERATVSIEASAEVPDHVISAIVGSYWLEEVQMAEELWDADEEFGNGIDDSGPRYQG